MQRLFQDDIALKILTIVSCLYFSVLSYVLFYGIFVNYNEHPSHSTQKSYKEVVLHNESYVLDMNLNANRINKIYQKHPELSGKSYIVSIKENMFDTMDIDLRSKYVTSSIRGRSIDKHATDMATLIAGKGVTSQAKRGIAYDASITSSDYTSLGPDAYEHYQSNNILVQNHSYGTVIENQYGSEAKKFDSFVYKHQNILHVMSSGNIFGANQIDPFRKLTGNFKNAKNVLTVGAVDSTLNVAPFSASGPTHDGRIKPEITAYSSVGTSNAAATVSGIAVLLHQSYFNQYKKNASVATLKAVIIAGAIDIKEPGPDNRGGYGMIHGLNSVDIIKRHQIIEDKIVENEEKKYIIKVPQHTGKVTIVLTWIDPPPSQLTESKLMNDLDMTVKTQDNKTILPWVLSQKKNLNTPAFRGRNNRDIVEMITVNNPDTGNLELTINSKPLATIYQEFSIAYYFEDYTSFAWTHPIQNENFNFNSKFKSQIFWDSNLKNTKGDLFISIDNGESFNRIAYNIDIKKGGFKWAVPNLNSNKAILRMHIAGKNYDSKAFRITKSHL